jgi:ectoine hydroxylase-related dioxygenase (phytanoyl-CoA dioxygenase family)
MADAAIRAERSRYEADGFTITEESLFPPDFIARAVAGMDAVRRGAYDTGRPPRPSPWNPGDALDKLCKIEQPQFASQALRELLCYPTLGALAAELTGASRVQVWWVQLLYKPSLPAGRPAGTNIGWHQDRTYWGNWEEGSELFTAWIALSNVREESGPMRFVRGSHRWGLLPEGDFFAQDLAGQQRAISLPTGETWQEVAALLPLGGVSFHDDYTLHGSGPNVSGSPRRSLAVHLRTQNSRPVQDRRTGLTQFIDDTELCPVIYPCP